MNRFKKAFRRQLIILPVIAILFMIGGTIIYEIRKNAYQQISGKEFTRLAVKYEITDFSRLGNGFEMETPAGKKYFHDFNSYVEQEQFESLILDKFGSFGYGNSISFYEVGIPIIIGILFGVLLFNIVVILWFVTLFDLLKSEFEENHNKWIWLICLLFLPLITPLFYMLISENQKRKYSGPMV